LIFFRSASSAAVLLANEINVACCACRVAEMAKCNVGLPVKCDI
jgi:hypothetical protein